MLQLITVSHTLYLRPREIPLMPLCLCLQSCGWEETQSLGRIKPPETRICHTSSPNIHGPLYLNRKHRMLWFGFFGPLCLCISTTTRSDLSSICFQWKESQSNVFSHQDRHTCKYPWLKSMGRNKERKVCLLSVLNSIESNDVITVGLKHLGTLLAFISLSTVHRCKCNWHPKQWSLMRQTASNHS